MTRIYVLNGHPAESSLSKQLGVTYARTAEASGHEVRICHLHEMDFDSDYGFGGYSQTKPLEPDLQGFVRDLEWCEHFVMTTPMWWGGLPAKLKGLFDRALLPGQAFDPRNTTMGIPAPLLKGRSGRVFLTADTPGWAMSLFYKKAMLRQVEKQILGFIGLKPVKTSFFAPASHPERKAVESWLTKTQKLAAKAA
ncbi:Putative NADPH-quinone reductase (modulator of drug activity B) [Phaeobacter sp. CECT 5382]|uniref:NAD(P)H-dependent oxidoreductase n=1 Tax=Phaeobacter sp. CECT 5382 TaxID=1712645 RepID=UPI0006DA7DC2|nr:NAD(P)H-dependent oxidoreductase [Phaeobacter sp. CECT 5382]CUH88541.1 Putative NADPH-quinone reductase (modulator of drug activity B) [Phaeobacter sp. CECT 5382]